MANTMIIDYKGVQLTVVDDGKGGFALRPVDVDVDKQQIRDELGQLRAEREKLAARIEQIIVRRDAAAQRRLDLVDLLAAVRADKDALDLEIADYKGLLESAGDIGA